MTNERTAALRDTVLSALADAHDGHPDIAGCFFVPGRIEVLGKHTDYAGGRSLLAAVDRGFVVAAARRPDGVVRVIDSITGEQAELDESRADGAGAQGNGLAGASHRASPVWAMYPETVLRRCTRDFPATDGGADIAFASNLPQAAGLSSSSALVVAVFLALDAVRGFSRTGEYTGAIQTAEDLAGYLGAVENGLGFGTLPGGTGVGTMGGSEDHTAILCARPGRIVQYRYAPVRFETDVRLPSTWTFAVASSGVRAEKAGAAAASYNRLSSSTRRLVQLWRDAGAGDQETLAEIVSADPDAPLRLREIVRQRAAREADDLLTRLAQFTTESEELVPGACEALRRRDLAAFSSFVQRSQHHAEHALHNQVPETIHLVDTARSFGAAAASAFGAGFGGSVWALVNDDTADEFLCSWQSAYDTRFPEHVDEATFFTTPAAAPASRLTL